MYYSPIGIIEVCVCIFGIHFAGSLAENLLILLFIFTTNLSILFFYLLMCCTILYIVDVMCITMAICESLCQSSVSNVVISDNM